MSLNDRISIVPEYSYSSGPAKTYLKVPNNEPKCRTKLFPMG